MGGTPGQYGSKCENDVKLCKHFLILNSILGPKMLRDITHCKSQSKNSK